MIYFLCSPKFPRRKQAFESRGLLLSLVYLFISVVCRFVVFFRDEHEYVRMFRLPDSVSGKADADG